jgi:hypothetical protein
LEGAPEALKVQFGTEATIAGMTANTPLWDNNNITQAEFTTLCCPSPLPPPVLTTLVGIPIRTPITTSWL